MKPWHAGLAETKHIVVFPPLGQERAFEAAKERLDAHLRERFPGYEFELADRGLYDEASVIPMCGTVGDGATGGLLAPPSEETLRQIEAELRQFDSAGRRLS
ncbi:MAG: hypothetical protein EOO23_06695 [Comamonadaceae bacterium]|nr:MAG: hypothetical protein EOO23_06695 [Comamonadaceae bacterium]